MNRLTHLLTVILILLILPTGSVFAQKSLPKVPITYSGDTNKTIERRMQWIEAAKKEGNSVMWWSIGSPAERKEIIAEFNKVYPSIKVEYWRGQTEEIGTKTEMEFTANRRTVDVVLGGDTANFPRWRKLGRLQKFTDLIPGIEKWDKRFYSVTGDSAQAGNNAITPQYNTKLVSPAEVPRSWEAMLNPKWKGQLGTQTDPKPWWTIALAEGGWGLEKTIDFVTKLKAQIPNMQNGPSQGHSLLIAGNFKIYTNDNLRHVILSKEKGAPVDWCPVSPIIITGPSVTMPARAPHPNAVRLFVEWFLSPEGRRVDEQVSGYGFANAGSGSRLSEILKGHTLAVRTEEVILKAVEMGIDEKLSKILIGE
jgi:ABC-type Fe3+ transport system substrate-binding protein